MIIDAELVACDVAGKPSFGELMTGARHGCCAWCFDLLEIDGTNQTMAPLEYRRHLLSKLLKRAKSDTLRMSENFRDPIALLKAAEIHGLEGIVSKLREDRYRSGKNPGWVKVKTAAWRAANRIQAIREERGPNVSRHHHAGADGRSATRGQGPSCLSSKLARRRKLLRCSPLTFGGPEAYQHVHFKCNRVTWGSP